MGSNWQIADIDLRKSRVKLSKQGASSGKTLFFSNILEVKLNDSTLVVICQDCVWMVDVETGLRRRLNGHVSDNQVLPATQGITQDIPLFLQKK